MTRGDFDPDVDWNDRDRSPEEPDDGFELLPPDYLQAESREAQDVEKEFFEPYPGQSDDSKVIDPDEWHH